MIESKIKITVVEAITVILTCKIQSKPDKNSCVRSFKLIFRSNTILVPIFEVGEGGEGESDRASQFPCWHNSLNFM